MDQITVQVQVIMPNFYRLRSVSVFKLQKILMVGPELVNLGIP